VREECNYEKKTIDKFFDDINFNLKQFMRRRQVFGQNFLKKKLNEISEDKGRFVCLLGGKNTGKSLALNALSRDENESRAVILVSMRSGYSNIISGALAVIHENKDTLWKDSQAAMQALSMTVPKSKSLDSLLRDLSTKSDKAITLVVDEANMALAIDDYSSEEKMDQARATLSLFTMLTKEERMVRDY
jgi:hypothetical protein